MYLPFSYAKIYMGGIKMKKGQKKRVWTKEQKIEIIGKNLNEHISVRTLEEEYNADRKGNWQATKPLEIVVSDMTCIKHKGTYWEWTYLLDVFNNEIIASSVTNKVGSNLPYYHCLEYLIEKKKEQTYPVTLHTDQGSVYSSAGFYQTHKDYTNIIRSMSRAGTPTDNPIIESLNGWIKEEMRIDFNLKSVEGIPSFIEKYVHYFNNERLSYKLNYKTPVQYRIEQGFE